MNAFFAILTVFSAPVDVAQADGPLTLTPVTTLTISNTTEKNTASDCARTRKTLIGSGYVAYCSEVSASK